MKRMPFLRLIAAAALIVLQSTHAAQADNMPAAQETASTVTFPSSPAQPVRVAWDRVGAVA